MIEAKNACMSFYIIRKILNEKGNNIKWWFLTSYKYTTINFNQETIMIEIYIDKIMSSIFKYSKLELQR